MIDSILFLLDLGLLYHAVAANRLFVLHPAFLPR